MPRFRPERRHASRDRRPGRPQPLEGGRRRDAAREDHGKSEQAQLRHPEGNVRNKVAFTKAQKDVEKSAKELVKLAKEAKDDEGCRQEGEGRRQSREEVGRIHRRTRSRPPKSSARSPAKRTPRSRMRKTRSKVKKSAPTATKTSASRESVLQRRLLTNDFCSVGRRRVLQWSAPDNDLLRSNPAERAQENLALDEALLIEADAGRGSALVRLWDPREYAVVLGASCRMADDIFLERLPGRRRRDSAPLERRRHGRASGRASFASP